MRNVKKSKMKRSDDKWDQNFKRRLRRGKKGAKEKLKQRQS